MRYILDVVSMLSGGFVLLCLWTFFIMAQVTGIPDGTPHHGKHSVIPISQIPRAIHQTHVLEASLVIALVIFIGTRVGARRLAWRDPNTIV